ncbi:hypothetical protein GQ607_003753 [Colletotrichum asianum]|uniref:Uncharacterized protein n=1 Tax=Colletotrichum asianum TaxID=702518 RepID=A0A8H3WMV8_9PEZI|nr:hypothetical protein GQ607_003753 [Colletotrichum asianum]
MTFVSSANIYDPTVNHLALEYFLDILAHSLPGWSVSSMATLPNMSNTELAPNESDGQGWFMEILGKIAISLPYLSNAEDTVTTDANNAAFRNGQQLAKVEAKMARAMSSAKPDGLPTWFYDEVREDIEGVENSALTNDPEDEAEMVRLSRDGPTQSQKDNAASRVVRDPTQFLRSMTMWNESRERVQRAPSSSDLSHTCVDVDSFIEKLKLGFDYATFSKKIFEALVERASCCTSEERYHMVRLRMCSHGLASLPGEKYLDMFCGHSDQPEGWHTLRGSITL